MCQARRYHRARKFRQSAGDRGTRAARPCRRAPSPGGTPEYDGGVNAAADTPETAGTPELDDASGFVESLMDTDLYSIGAYFCDRNPEFVDEVVERGSEIESEGLSAWAAREAIEVEEAFGMLLTGLAVRYYKAVTG